MYKGILEFFNTWYSRNMSDKTISITSGTIFRALLIIGLVWLLYLLRDLVLVLLAAVVIASSIEPMTQWFLRYRIPRVIAVIGIYLGLVAALFGVLYFFVPSVLRDLAAALSALGQAVGGLSFPNYFGNEFLGGEGLSSRFSLEGALGDVRTFLSELSGNLFQTISTIFGGLLSFVLILVFSFYFSVQERGIENFLRLITPIQHERYIIDLWKRSQRKIGRWMQGQLLLGLIVGVLVYLGLTVLGVEYALLLAVLAAIFELIPLFGPILAAVPAVAFAFLDSATLGFMTLGLYVIIQQFENYLIYPLVVRKVVGVSPIIVIISLIVGGKIAGFLGILLAVPVAAALLELTDDIQKRKLKEEEERDKAEADSTSA